MVRRDVQVKNSHPRGTEIVARHDGNQMIRAAMEMVAASGTGRRSGLYWAFVGLLAAIAVGPAGCGSKRPALAPVTGTVSLDGKPLARGTLTFEAKGLRPATARIEQGRILEATTYRPGDGIPVGQQRIAVFARAEPDGAGSGPSSGKNQPATRHGFPASMTARSLLPPRYNEPSTSGLSVDIGPGSNTLDLPLTTDPR